MPVQIGPNLERYLAGVEVGCVLCSSDEGEVGILVKAADADIAGWRGVPVMVQWQLALYPTAPLLRLYVEMRDRSESALAEGPYALETYLNVRSPADLRDARRQARQSHHTFHFFGGGRGRCIYRYSKRISHGETQREELGEMIQQALEYAEEVGDRYDFNRAKAEFWEDHPI